MEQPGTRKYVVDTVIIWISLAVMWCMLIFILFQVVPLSDEFLTRVAIVSSAVLAGVFATSALIALLLHLRRNRGSLYEPDAPPVSPPAERNRTT